MDIICYKEPLHGPVIYEKDVEDRANFSSEIPYPFDPGLTRNDFSSVWD